MPAFDNRTKCDLSGLTYDFETRQGELFMGPMSAADMTGSIRIFEAIDPEVVFIQTLRVQPGDIVKDTAYVRNDDGWHPVPAPRKHVEPMPGF
jgi:hypothetical protein